MRRLSFAALALAVLVVARAPLAAQAARPGVVSVQEATLVAEGWAALAKGDLVTATARRESLRQASPRGLSALTLGIEIDIARAGGLGALDGYERWLGNRTQEVMPALRRISAVRLAELEQTGASPGIKSAALAALAADGDAAAERRLAEAVGQGSVGDVRAAAALGNPAAVMRISRELSGPAGNKIGLMEALGQSKSQAAIAPLAAMLADARPEHRAAAAQALGDLGATDQIGKIKTLLSDPTATLVVKIAASAALFKLNDFTGYQQLQSWLQSEVPDLRLSAARALSASETDKTWVQPARTLVADPDAAVRLGAIRLIAPQDPEFVRPYLDELLNSPDRTVRELAEQASGDVTTNTAQLRGLLRASDGQAVIRAASRLLALSR